MDSYTNIGPEQERKWADFRKSAGNFPALSSSDSKTPASGFHKAACGTQNLWRPKRQLRTFLLLESRCWLNPMNLRDSTR
ncbi:hypothetical protein BN2476_1000003 [Paraburkholderia piptadeniae]|uniref:Uncharacterized protein n=1 Tax=Paraburkholderia piptadeniae TaxID=1701573 RepID=A0A1N7SUJ7_9BURK|nr:hypothetical protein BN2476_1000003 [Paraburkholderia piptadeniae]